MLSTGLIVLVCVCVVIVSCVITSVITWAICKPDATEEEEEEEEKGFSYDDNPETSGSIFDLGHRVHRQLKNYLQTITLPAETLQNKDCLFELNKRVGHEPVTHGILVDILLGLKEGDVVIDAGTHVGDTLIKMIQHSMTGVKFIAIDPSSTKQEFIKSLEHLNPWMKKYITRVKTGLSDRTFMAVENQVGQSGGWTLTEDARGNIPIRSLDDVLTDLKLHANVKLIHLDVEGYEHKVVKGALKTIASSGKPPLMLEVCHDKGDMASKLVKTLGYVNIWSGEGNTLFMKRRTFHIIVVCTDNYVKVGGPGTNSLAEYARRRGYKFTLKQNKEPGLHVNFSKNRAMIDVMKETNLESDYYVTIDADVEVLDPEFELQTLIRCENATLFAPLDKYGSKSQKPYSFINAGFIIWKGTRRSIEINEDWIRHAKGVAKVHASVHPRQQNVFQHSLMWTSILMSEVTIIDCEQVGMTWSEKIRMTKNTIPGWQRMGSPQIPFNLDLS